MTRDDLAPIGQDDPGFPCPKCNGGGVVIRWVADDDGGTTCNHSLCDSCGGSGRLLDVPPEFSAANPANLARMDTK